MGLLGFSHLFGSSEARSQGTLRKLGQKVTQRYGPPENRQKAIDQLGEIGTSEALAVLCLRFTVRAEPGITDDEEKETVRSILVDAGSLAVAAAKQFVAQHESGIAWGLRVLEQLMPLPEVALFTAEQLVTLGKSYSRDPEKKLILISWLESHVAQAKALPASNLYPALLPLLEDASDDVRVAGARLLGSLFSAEPNPIVTEALWSLLERERDNRRVIAEALSTFAAIGLDVGARRSIVEPVLGSDFVIDGGRVRRRVPR